MFASQGSRGVREASVARQVSALLFGLKKAPATAAVVRSKMGFWKSAIGFVAAQAKLKRVRDGRVVVAMVPPLDPYTNKRGPQYRIASELMDMVSIKNMHQECMGLNVLARTRTERAKLYAPLRSCLGIQNSLW